ncbi:MAG: sensor histidine kinase, partial [Desulfatiglandales bacterium]
GHQQELQRLTQRLFATQEEERRRIARELHDEAGQSLTAINLALERLQGLIPPDNIKLIDELHEIRRMVLRASTEIRQLSYKLHPTLLVDLGLEPALHSYFKQIGARVGIQIDFKMIGFDRRLDLDMETTLYRFAQEALTNTLKHSGAEHFRLSIIKSYPNIIFLAEDDGCGFDPLDVGEKNSSLGLLGMRERSSLLGGTFSVRSQIGKGTKIRIELPLGGKDHEPKDKGIDS